MSNLEVVLDLETLAVPDGKGPQASMILSIGAVAFDPSAVTPLEVFITPSLAQQLSNGAQITSVPYPGLPMFYSPVSLHQSLRKGFAFDKSTVKFWESQSFNMLAHAAMHKEDMAETLKRFMGWLNAISPGKLWANSPRFDVEILRLACVTAGVDYKFPFWDERDLRSVLDKQLSLIDKSQYPMPEYYVKHHALFDAAHEAHLVQQIYAGRRAEMEALKAKEVTDE